jgi:hypothetical protein
MKSFARKSFTIGISYILVLALAGCGEMSEPAAKEVKIMLWNGMDLTGWKVVPEEAIAQQTWSVKDGILYCQGRPNGYIRTEQQYSNYHLHVEWRWPENAAQGRSRNSGVFVHESGPDKVWPKLIECQLMAGEAGQFVLFNGMAMTVNGRNMQNPNRQFVSIPKKQPSSEKPAGEWNSYDIYCRADTIQCYVNNILQNEGSAVTPSSGSICLQSEGSPIEFRNIYLEPVHQEQP